jgi:hypothetical protein
MIVIELWKQILKKGRWFLLLKIANLKKNYKDIYLFR